jgi:hypothetical protein
MTNNVVELDNHYSMNPEQTLHRAFREPLIDVLVIGRTEKGITLISSDMFDKDAHWMLLKAADAVFDR